jgi:hypothetical protein
MLKKLMYTNGVILDSLRVRQYQFGCGISKMVGPKKQGFCPKINMLKGNFDTNYFEPLMILSS